MAKIILTVFIGVSLVFTLASCSQGSQKRTGNGEVAGTTGEESGIQVDIVINQKDGVRKEYGGLELKKGEVAYEALVVAAERNDDLTFETEDYGGDLGLAITSMIGYSPQGNEFWEFLVNGEPSMVGISNYEVKDGDVLEFRVATF